MEKDPFSLPPQGPPVEQQHTQVMDHTGHIYDIYTKLEAPLEYRQLSGDSTPESTIENQSFDSELALSGRDRGEISVSGVITNSRVAYHGLRFVIARKRQELAEARISKLTRKDNLYSQSRQASTSPRSAPPNMRDTTVVEKVMDTRQTRNTRRAQEKGLRAYREQLVHGQKIDKKGKPVNTIGAPERAGRIIGTTLNQARGNITAAQARADRAKHKAIESNAHQKYMHKTERKHQRADRRSRQPIAARWRSLRRLNAEDRVNTSRRIADEHLQKAIDIKNSRP